MSKHTLGPWTVTPCYGGGTIPIFFNIACKAGHDIGMASKNASPYDGNEVGIEEAEANARLMAAAPDLLEALMRLASPDMGNEDMDFALSAIAKATGGEG